MPNINLKPGEFLCDECHYYHTESDGCEPFYDDGRDDAADAAFDMSEGY